MGWSVRAPWLLAALAIGCAHGHAARARAPGNGLGIPAEASHDYGPFRVVFASPEGALDSLPREVTVVFNRAMRAIDASAPPLAAEVRRAGDPAPFPGHWEWFGTRSAVFRWDESVPNASEMTVTVAATTRSLGGDSLGAPHAFVFRTPRPLLTSASYRQDIAAPGDYPVDVAFNQPVAYDEVKRALRFEARRHGERIAIPYRLEGDRENFVARLDTIRDLEDVVAIADPSLRGEQGPLLAGAAARVPLPEIGPLRATFECERVPAGGCDTSGSARLVFSKPVTADSLAKSVVLPGRARVDRASLPDPAESVWLYDLIELVPRGKYRIVVKAGLTAQDGDRLARDVVLDFSGADLPPQLEWQGQNAIVEAARPDLSFAVGSLNVASYHAVRAPVDEGALVGLLYGHDDVDALRARPGAVTTPLAPRAAPNEWAQARVAIPDHVRAGGAFAFALAREGAPPSRGLVSVTDLGVTSKWSAYEGLLWITRLSTGAPVPGAQVTVNAIATTPPAPRARELLRATADARGIVAVPSEIGAELARTNDAALAVVRDGADWTYATLPRVVAARPLAHLFTERSLYRPGETVYVKGYARTPSARGLTTPVGREVHVGLEDHAGHPFFQGKAKLDAFGAFSVAAPIPAGATLGYARAYARLDGEDAPRSDAEASFAIDMYRAVEFKVSVATDRPAYVRGDTARVQIEGAYLFGAKMHGVETSFEATHAPTAFQIPGLDEFSIRDDEHAASAPLASGETKLGADGRATTSMTLDLPAARGPELLDVEAAVLDVARTFSVAGRTTALVHAGEHYIGVRATRRSGPLYPGGVAQVDVVAAKPDGARVGEVPAHVVLVLEPDDGVPQTVGACDVTTRLAEPVSCSFTVAQVGRYAFRATAKDPRGNALVAAQRFWVTAPPRPGSAAAAAAARPPPRAPAEPPPPPADFGALCRMKHSDTTPWLDLERQGDERTVGDVARICVRSPRPGLEALVTVEREGILRRETRTLAGTAEILEIPITADMFPDARIVVHEVAGRSAKIATQGVDRGPPFSVRGEAYLRVVAPEKALAVEVSTGAPEHRPGSDLRIALKVKDGRGRPTRAQVTLYAVDEGVLSLMWYRRPEPADVFSQWRYGDVETDDSRSRLYVERGRIGGAHRVKAPSLRSGSTQVGDRDRIARSKLPPTAFFLPSVLVGDDGAATVTVKLPDNVTTWKVFAVAATEDDAFGSAETTFVTNQPLLVRAALPRFLRDGDRFDATMVADSLAKEPIAAKVTMQAWGAVVGSGVRALALAPGGHEPITFPLVASGTGAAQVRFRVDGGELGDAIDTTVAVRAPYTLETLAFAGDTRARATERLGDLRAIRGDVGGLELRVGRTPLAGLAEGFAQLDEYPYGCTEQLVSRLVPLLLASGMAKDLGVPAPPDGRARAADAVARLLLHQRSDGGFGLWPESGASVPWLTTYASWALLAARRADIAIPESVVLRATHYLDADENAARPDDAAFREDVLASLGAAREARIRALAADPHGSLVARALLAHAAATVDPALAASLAKELESKLHVSGAAAVATEDAADRSYLSSDVRATALVLRALVAASPAHPLVPRLVAGLLAQRRAGRWPTTHDAAWSLLALDDARKTMGLAGTGDARVLLGDELLARGSLGPASAPLVVSLPAARLLAAPGASLAFDGSGGPLHYEGILKFARAEPPREPLEHGLSIERVMRPRTGGAPLRAGDYVDVELLVTTPVAREQVVLDDPIAAGMEPVNARFSTTSRMEQANDAGDAPFVHREMKDDRIVTFIDRLPPGSHKYAYLLRATTAGRFTLPAAKAECMYAPDVYGRTAASVVVVR